jgi:hypothetical protein
LGFAGMVYFFPAERIKPIAETKTVWHKLFVNRL